ncbi:hypothetical protein EF53_230 [Enterococcus phage 53]|nr:hypothetical protein EF53_230 [Enterococcus phage 53]
MVSPTLGYAPSCLRRSQAQFSLVKGLLVNG